eukprot:6202447-Pleurochrysis_carterae.AAC.12
MMCINMRRHARAVTYAQARRQPCAVQLEPVRVQRYASPCELHPRSVCGSVRVRACVVACLNSKEC